MVATIPAETNDEFVRLAFEQCPFGLIVVNGDGQIRVVNQEVERLFGYIREELLRQPVEMLLPEHIAVVHSLLRGQHGAIPAARRMAVGQAVLARHKDGRKIPVKIELSRISTSEGAFIVAAVMDISEFRHLEERLGQMHKLETIGNLACGVAHDFNNLLHGITTFIELARDEASNIPAIVGNLDRALDAAGRGRNLAKRILSFARKTEPVRALTSLVAPVRDAVQLLRATLPANIEIRDRLDLSTPFVMADTNELYEIAMNLGTNAAHAMEKGGVIEVRVESNTVNERFRADHPGVRTGLHARLSVLDTGTGIPDDAIGRVFEPFFTTKPAGNGTGLGLSIVDGILRSLGGYIDVTSQVGKGTRFDVYIPAASPNTSSVDAEGCRRQTPRHILLVGDEDRSAGVGKRVLDAGDFDVTVHSSSAKALEDFRSHPESFDLLITDSMTSATTGPGLVEQVLAVRPNMPVLVVSGTSESMSADTLKGAGSRLLSNPYHSADLRAVVEELL